MKLSDKLSREIDIEEALSRRDARRPPAPVDTVSSRRRDTEPTVAIPRPSDRGPAHHRSLSAVHEIPTEEYAYGGITPDEELTRFHDRLIRGKILLCETCGNVMTRSSRMMFSPLAGIMLMILGASLMFMYGVATNFYDVPWFLKFLLPASYYIGSIFLGVGILFFFARERVWRCQRCLIIRKR